jgi:hypothetical protein
MSAPACDPARKAGLVPRARGALIILALAAGLVAAANPATANAEPPRVIALVFVWSPVYLRNVALPAKPCTQDWRRRARCRPTTRACSRSGIAGRRGSTRRSALRCARPASIPTRAVASPELCKSG